MALYYYGKYNIASGYLYNNETYQGQTSSTEAASYTGYGVTHGSGGYTYYSDTGYFYTSSPQYYICPTNGYLFTIDKVISDTEFRIYTLLFHSPSSVDVTISTYYLDKTVISKNLDAASFCFAL